MTRRTSAVCWLFLGIAAALACGGGDEASGTRCATHADCENSAEARALGRCAPQDVYCAAQRCQARCAGSCQVVSPELNPCSDPALICNEPASGDSPVTYCTALPIACQSAGDCPLYRPLPEGEWACNGNMCRFPGYAYASE
jgi:hypothetical protein